MADKRRPAGHRPSVREQGQGQLVIRQVARRAWLLLGPLTFQCSRLSSPSVPLRERHSHRFFAEPVSRFSSLLTFTRLSPRSPPLPSPAVLMPSRLHSNAGQRGTVEGRVALTSPALHASTLPPQ